MKISVSKGKVADTSCEATILALFEGKELAGAALQIDTESNGLIGELIGSHDFEAKPSQISVIYTRGSLPAKRIVLVGLGKYGEFNLDKLRAAFAKAMQHLRTLNIKGAAASIDVNSPPPDRKDKVAQAVVEGALLGLYQYAPFKTVDRENLKDVEQLTILTEENDFPLIKAAVEEAETIAHAVLFTRDLVSAPANRMTPAILAKEAGGITGRRGVSCTVLDKVKLNELGMNSLLSVASGSNEEPKFIILEYKGGGTDAAPIVLVGKGVTFDSGGICIKPSDKMDEMKSDMAGGGAVMGAIMASADLQLPLNIVGLIPAAENMPGGTALKPGDVFASYSGKTIEVINTDAEGRLILADALAYASNYKPAAIIDVATLTGACVIALGDDVIGMLGTDDKLKKELQEAGRETGELVWELPLWESYHEPVKSDIADYKNYGGRPAGAITAAAFLSKFVGDFPWVHLDIAGPAWADKDKTYIPKGASGIGVRLLVEFLRSRAGQGSVAGGS
ncbi:MAG: leucyl aminopeptidase [Syntrophorhabdales bacterium]